MKKENKKEEIQSRRDFFKNAARKGLPFIAAIALTNMPVVSQALESKMELGCDNGCYGGCYYTCKDSCDSTCKDSCDISCKGTCEDTCKGTCENTCWRSGYLH